MVDVYTITKKRVARYEIFCELPLLSVSIRIYLQVCTRYVCSTLYEKVFRANEGSTLGKIFRSRDHVARFPNLEDHVQSTCPFGRVLVSQHPITCSTNDLILSFLAFFDQRICSKRELRFYRKIILPILSNYLPGLFALNLRATAPNFGTTTVSLATVQSRFRENNCPLSSMLFNSCRDTLRPNFRAPTT